MTSPSRAIFNGTNSHFTGPLTFHIDGVTVADFAQNAAGYYAAADFGVLGGRFTGEAGGMWLGPRTLNMGHGTSRLRGPRLCGLSQGEECAFAFSAE